MHLCINAFRPTKLFNAKNDKVLPDKRRVLPVTRRLVIVEGGCTAHLSAFPTGTGSGSVLLSAHAIARSSPGAEICLL